MQGINTTAAVVLRAILDGQPLTEAKVRFAWRLAAGATVSGATSVSWTEEGRLIVRVKSDEWRREVARARPIVLERMRELVGADAIRTMHIEAPPEVGRRAAGTGSRSRQP